MSPGGRHARPPRPQHGAAPGTARPCPARRPGPHLGHTRPHSHRLWGPGSGNGNAMWWGWQVLGVGRGEASAFEDAAAFVVHALQQGDVGVEVVVGFDVGLPRLGVAHDPADLLVDTWATDSPRVCAHTSPGRSPPRRSESQQCVGPRRGCLMEARDATYRSPSLAPSLPYPPWRAVASTPMPTPASADAALRLPSTSSIQVRRHIDTRGGCRRVALTVVCPDGRSGPGPRSERAASGEGWHSQDPGSAGARYRT